MLFGRAPQMVDAAHALPGRSEPMTIPDANLVTGIPMTPPFPDGAHVAVFAAGCFWGVERIFWQIPGVLTTAVGYAGGFTPNPTYEEVCSGRTGHAEAVLVVFDPSIVGYGELLRIFWEAHDPTQGMQQGNDIGTQYRSGIFTLDDDQQRQALESRRLYGEALQAAGMDPITSEVTPLGDLASNWFYAEDYHQQYLFVRPNGYCGVAGTGVTCPVPAID